MTVIIPDAAMAQHTAVVGKTGSGKTSTAKLAVEQVVAQGARVCILDPIKSDWWGLTSSADGQRPGLPFHILGGPRGHVPLHERAGRAIGEIVASGALPLSIIDMADFAPGGQAQFFVDFAPTLIRKMRGVVYLVIEEAHLFAPKERSGVGAENMSIHWAKMLATAGRSKGIRLILVTQRTQALHNALLGSCDTIIVHRLTAPADQEPVLKWLKANVANEIREKVAASLSSLRTGSGWLCSGEAQIFDLRHFPRIRTYDNTATPTGDSHGHSVKTAPVDQERLRAIVGEAVKDAEANDPKLLRARIAELERQANSLAVPLGISAEAHREALRTAQEDGYATGISEISRAALPVITHAIALLDDMKTSLSQLISNLQAEARPTTIPQPVRERVVPMSINIHIPTPRDQGEKPERGTVRERILGALAELAVIGIMEPDRVQVAFLAGYGNPRSPGFQKALGALKTEGLVDYPATPGTVTLSAAGRSAAPRVKGISSPAQLHERVLALLGGTHGKILRAVIAHYPRTMQRDDVAQRCGYGNPRSPGFQKALGRLRSLGLVSYPTTGSVAATDLLFLKGK